MKHGQTLKDVRVQLRKAKLANVAAVQITLRDFWRPIVWWRCLKFLYRNRRRQRLLETLSAKSMGFAWRSSIPRKKQRELGMLPKLS